MWSQLATVLKQPCIWYCGTFTPYQEAPPPPHSHTRGGHDYERKKRKKRHDLCSLSFNVWVPHSSIGGKNNNNHTMWLRCAQGFKKKGKNKAFKDFLGNPTQCEKLHFMTLRRPAKGKITTDELDFVPFFTAELRKMTDWWYTVQKLRRHDFFYSSILFFFFNVADLKNCVQSQTAFFGKK